MKKINKGDKLTAGRLDFLLSRIVYASHTNPFALNYEPHPNCEKNSSSLLKKVRDKFYANRQKLVAKLSKSFSDKHDVLGSKGIDEASNSFNQ